MIIHHAAMARMLGEQLGLPDEVLEALAAAYEQWDGRGWPGDLKGDAVPVASRLAQLAEFVEVAHRLGGVEAAKALAGRRGGKQFDPVLAALMCAEAEIILSGLDAVAAWDAVIGAEPGLGVVLSGERFDAALEAIANFVDLKSPYTLGHARAVADLAGEAGAQLGLAEADVRDVAPSGYRARPRPARGVERDLGQARAAWRGRVGAGADLSLPDRAHAPPVRGAGAAGRDRRAAPRAARRLGVPARAVGRRDLPPGPDSRCRRRLPGDARAAPLSAAALGSTRPPGELRADVTAGRLDAEAVEAVLGAAGHRVSRRREGPAGLTSREVEVLRLLARGLSNKQIAERLVISPKTAGNHVEHIYAKIDASSRATASLFAMQHGLLPEEELRPPADAEDSAVITRIRGERMESAGIRLARPISRHHLFAGVSARFEGLERLSENRGVPGSSPGLAIDRSPMTTRFTAIRL